MKTAVFCLFFVLMLPSLPIVQQSQRRLALLIGNADYGDPNYDLANPANDVYSMKDVLSSLGFEVMICIDCTEQQMIDKIHSFENRLRKTDFEATLFYYAGHGLRTNGVNYMVPVDVKGLTEASVEYECLEVGRVLNVLENEHNSTNILVLDACLNNPFDKHATWRGLDGGLPEWAKTLPPSGTFAAYATEPGREAKDGNGSNGLYTSKLLKYLKVPNLSLEQVFKYTRKEVMDDSNNRQIPWEFNRTVGDFYFRKQQDAPNIDSDGDGIPNVYDKCPNEAGVIDYGGCLPPTNDRLLDSNIIQYSKYNKLVRNPKKILPNQRGHSSTTLTTSIFEGECPDFDTESDYINLEFSINDRKIYEQSGVIFVSMTRINDEDKRFAVYIDYYLPRYGYNHLKIKNVKDAGRYLFTYGVIFESDMNQEFPRINGFKCHFKK